MPRPTRSLARLVDGKDPYLVQEARGKSGNGKRNLAQIESDLVFLADAYLKGWSRQKMVDELNQKNDGLYTVSISMVQKSIDMLHKRWIASYLVDFDTAKSKELARIDKLEQEYWTAWIRSQQKIEETESEQIQDKQGSQRVTTPNYSRTRVKKKEINRDGNNTFLQGIQWCIEQRCKILGLTMNVSTQNINVNWRKEAQAQGVDPDGALNELVEQFLTAAQMGGTGGTGGVGEGSEDNQGHTSN